MDVKERLVADVANLNDKDVNVVSIGPSIKLNAVVVGVEDLKDSERAVLESYGPEVRVESDTTAVSDECSGIGNCAPAKAGLKIWTGDTEHFCSQGPFVHRENGQIRMITAGHCFGLNGGADQPWKHGPSGDAVRIADSGANTWSKHATNNQNDKALTDVGIFKETTQAYDPGSLNKIMLVNKDTNERVIGQIVSWTFASRQTEQAQVCRTGAASYRDPGFPSCGRIEATDQWKWSCSQGGHNGICAAIDHEWVVNIDSTAGDSGGPYYTPPYSDWSVSFYGIATHSRVDSNPTKRAWYTPTKWITQGLEQEINVSIDRFCVDWDCGPVTCWSWGGTPA